MARKLRYTVYDTWQHKYLRQATQPLGTADQLQRPTRGRAEGASAAKQDAPETRDRAERQARGVKTEWTRHPERAQRFPGIKSADAMLEKLGRFSEFVIINGKGEIVK